MTMKDKLEEAIRRFFTETDGEHKDTETSLICPLQGCEPKEKPPVHGMVSRHAACLEERCAWWQSGQCAIKTIGGD